MSAKTDEEFMKFIEVNWPRTDDDYKNSIDFINNYFNKEIIINTLNWNECIIVERKGAAIFKEQQSKNKILSSLHTISDLDIDRNREIIDNRSILIFDDSIKNGITMRKILNKVLKFKPRSITVGTLISREDSLQELKIDFPKIHFLPTIELTKSDNFGATYAKKIFPYLGGYICSPLQNDHPQLVIKFSRPPTQEVIMRFFKPYGEIYTDNWGINGSKNRVKMGFLLDSSIATQFNIINVLEKIGALDKNELLIKVKLYLKREHEGVLVLQPMLLEGFNANNLISHIIVENLDYQVKRRFLFDFLVQKFLLEYLINTDFEVSSFSVSMPKKY